MSTEGAAQDAAIDGARSPSYAITKAEHDRMTEHRGRPLTDDGTGRRYRRPSSGNGSET